MRLKEYKAFGHDKGKKEKPRYLFTTSGFNEADALKSARFRVKGAKVIDKVRRA